MKNLKKALSAITERMNEEEVKNMWDFLEGNDDEKFIEIGYTAISKAIFEKVIPAYNFRCDSKNALTIGKALVMSSVEMGARGEWDYLIKFTEKEF